MKIKHYEALLAALTAAVLGLSCPALAAPPEAPEGFLWEQTFGDEFNDTILNRAKWELVPDGPRREGYWTDDAISLRKGKLVIETFEKRGKFFSGGIRTKGNFEQTYGYFEARLKFPPGFKRGHWPTFWLTTPSVLNVNGNGIDGTEIDIIEKPRGGNVVEHGYVYDGYGPDSVVVFNQLNFDGISEGFHTAGVLWDKDKYVFYIDGKETWTTDAKGTSQVPQYLKLTEEIEAWTGDITKAKLPHQFVVDYVRAYQLKQGDVAPLDHSLEPGGTEGIHVSFEDGVEDWEAIWAQRLRSRTRGKGVPVRAATHGKRALEVTASTNLGIRPLIWATNLSDEIIANTTLKLNVYLPPMAFPGARKPMIGMRIVTGEVNGPRGETITRRRVKGQSKFARMYKLTWNYAKNKNFNWKADWAYLEIYISAKGSRKKRVRFYIDEAQLYRK